jgi:hypothetical protein
MVDEGLVDELITRSGNYRRCRHCTTPFQPPSDLADAAAKAARLVGATLRDQKLALLMGGPELSQLSAWVEGFCSKECLHNHALEVIAGRSAWWLKHQPREGAA